MKRSTVYVTGGGAGVDNVRGRQNSKLEKYPKMATNPCRPVRAVLGVITLQTSKTIFSINKQSHANMMMQLSNTTLDIGFD